MQQASTCRVKINLYPIIMKLIMLKQQNKFRCHSIRIKLKEALNIHLPIQVPEF